MFRVKMEFNLDGKDLEMVRKVLGRNNFGADDVKSVLEQEYVKNIADGTDRDMIIQVEEVSHVA